MISVDDHLERILASLSPVEAEHVSVNAAVGRVLRAAVVSSIDLPPWPNSAMDGFAVNSSDLEAASPTSPVTLPVTADIAAGSTEPLTLVAGSVMRIMTGAPIPSGCTAIVPIEHTAEFDQAAPTTNAPLKATVTFTAAVGERAHIRGRGEDVSAGHTVLAEGQLLTPNRIAAATAVGVTEVKVARRVRVAVISTGTELVAAGQTLRFGQIHDSNGPLLRALCAGAGTEVVSQQCVADDEDALRRAISIASDTADVLVLTGGASVGAHDTTRAVLDAQGEPESETPNSLRRVRFDKVAMQPGKPQGFGVLDSGTAVFALPGNPVSVWVSFHVFVAPALRALTGEVADVPEWQQLRVASGWTAPLGREQFMPVRIHSNHAEPLSVEPASAKGSGSHLAATLAQASGVARVAADVDQVRENDLVSVLLTSAKG